jgi:hypothetical protein
MQMLDVHVNDEDSGDDEVPIAASVEVHPD